ncbi:Kae1-associated kinase Bud32 [Candidozyma pseudohaemuli]|uniref:EKC/KEOPS complex subunit BUD32 n=1 Tax=Candidozyma pseudohaemuli TaxID=418784 RepID=A0A2P7YQW4_9ASCO|nr:Kae1-associated kinase Bud32 [[Candida] pseudohaemulonii]PSK38358.1 Kae1-associated kinase Bud32 [[Candida] pseudohaemulonii]
MTDAILKDVQKVVPHVPLSLVSQGAEALVFSTEVHPYSPHPKASRFIIKYRPPKPYRHPKIDALITKLRTVGEAKFMAKLAKIGVAAPALILLDAPNGVIWMDHVGIDLPNGQVSLIKNYLWHLEKEDKESCLSSEVEQVLKATGSAIAKLHLNDMIHGDLTTLNLILQENDVYLIDFGLSTYSNLPEDKAVDLYVMERAVLSTHSDYADQYNLWLLQGYEELHQSYASKGGRKKLQETIKKLEDVRLRGRKRSMLG